MRCSAARWADGGAAGGDGAVCELCPSGPGAALGAEAADLALQGEEAGTAS